MTHTNPTPLPPVDRVLTESTVHPTACLAGISSGNLFRLQTMDLNPDLVFQYGVAKQSKALNHELHWVLGHGSLRSMVLALVAERRVLASWLGHFPPETDDQLALRILDELNAVPVQPPPGFAEFTKFMAVFTLQCVLLSLKQKRAMARARHALRLDPAT